MARSTMAALITEVRRMINDQVGPGNVDPAFSDDDIQSVLDRPRHRLEVRQQQLRYSPTMTSTSTDYKDFYALDGWGWWEESATFYSATHATITPDTSDYMAGKWSWTTSQDIPLYMSGYTYDLFGAAADLLEELATQNRSVFSVDLGDQRLSRAQVVDNHRQLAKMYRRKARPRAIVSKRFDV